MFACTPFVPVQLKGTLVKVTKESVIPSKFLYHVDLVDMGGV